MGINLDTLRPEPTVEGYTTPGGYSYKVRVSSMRYACHRLFVVLRAEKQTTSKLYVCTSANLKVILRIHTRKHTHTLQAVKPIALAKVMNIARTLKTDYAGKDVSLSGIGGIDTGADAAEFILCGSDTVQVCTGVMIHGYPVIKNLCGGLQVRVVFVMHVLFPK